MPSPRSPEPESLITACTIALNVILPFSRPSQIAVNIAALPVTVRPNLDPNSFTWSSLRGSKHFIQSETGGSGAAPAVG